MKNKKVLSLILATTLIAASVSGCGKEAAPAESEVAPINEYETVTDDVELETVIASVANVGSSTATKEETVYVKSSATGSVDEVIVSNWLKNVDRAEKLVDTSDLEDIKNVKGKETYKANGNELVWDAKGEDIYYQGTTSKNLPIDIAISYKLNGQEISPEKLAGQSGHVTIELQYTNKSEQTIEIDGKEEVIYTPFAVVSGMRLDNAKFKNVTVKNGTVVSDGNNSMVVGMAFPGLVDSLNGAKIEDNELLEKIEDQLEIPSDITIDADVDDFELGMILTMISSDVMNSLGLDKVDTSLDTTELEDSMNEFKDAGNDLVEGTGKLRDGAQELADGTTDLVSGTNDLYDGVVKYTDGVDKVYDGADELYDGVKSLDKGADKLKDGASELKTGADNLQAGAKTLADGLTTVNSGASSLKTGAEQVSAGVQQVSQKMGAVGSAATGAKQISDGIDLLVQGLDVQTTADDEDIKAISVSGVVSGATASQAMMKYVSDSDLANMGLSDDEITAVKAYISGLSSQVIPGIVDAATTGAAQTTAVTTANSTKAKIKASITSGGLQTGANQLAAGLAASADPSAAQSLQTLVEGAQAVATGAGSLAEGTAKLKAGADTLYEGTKKLSSGAGSLKDGAKQLSDGSGKLKDGTSKLKDGTKELHDNSADLVDGSKKLADGAVELTDGIGKLLDGTIELNDGMIKFNEEGIKEITSIFDTDVDSMRARLEAIVNAGKAYKSFSDTGVAEDGNVKFIIETAAIKK